MNLAKKTAATLTTTAALFVTPFAAATVATSAAPEPVKTAAATVALPEAQAANRCHTHKSSPSRYVGGCTHVRTKLVVRCEDGNRVKYVDSGSPRYGTNSASCGWAFGFYSATAAHLVPFYF